jgi:PhnB protein
VASSFKPKGYSTVSPYIVVKKAGLLIEFLEKLFGARQLQRIDAPNGTMMHAEIQIDDTIVMLGEAGENWPATPTHVHIYVADVDLCFRMALDLGATSVQPPDRRGQEPNRRAAIRDSSGNTWWISTKVA